MLKLDKNPVNLETEIEFIEHVLKKIKVIKIILI